MAINPTDYDPDYMRGQFGTKCLITSTSADKYLDQARKKSTVPEDSYSRWCGGKNGFDLYVERVHE